MKQKYIPNIGDQYRDWEVIDDKIYTTNSNRATYWKVRCKCGFEALRSAIHLVNNKVACCKSCAKRKLSFEQSYLNKIKKRAKKSNIEFDLELDFIINLLKEQDYKCKLSGLPIEIRKVWHGQINQTASLDRIDNTKGYIKNNVQWLHKDVNNMKHTFTEKYFIDLCKRIGSSKCG